MAASRKAGTDGAGGPDAVFRESHAARPFRAAMPAHCTARHRSAASARRAPRVRRACVAEF
ncbi:hypothetical protein C6P78_20075 [Burkholderia multivorans]|nr:hypothetical protein C6P78_20075 [Burkholderia multivorans]